MKRFTIAALVENKYGVLTRVSGLFMRRGFNIDSLTVSETENPDFSYTTEIYTTGIALLTKFASQFDLLFLDIQLPDMTGI